ncbi:replication protein RepA [Methylocaldum szegediense]|uniref:Replication protein RepA n=1 Tax=Methylocaldum szegediense TaxID=73780 RepID=A0ABM9I9U7_9GAMM|nr:replication protein RepA [Methylocaldum szegediense]CAI8982806.1 Replication protein RepA [Methylocaldum szegediense]
MIGVGNRCGHNPAKPRWFDPPQKHADRPHVLRKLIERIRDYYSSPQKTLPGLNAVNESDRQQRSERREACICLLGCLLHYTDLVTLRVGIPQSDGSFQGLTMEFLAKTSGLGLRRAERAIHDLAAAGIVSIHPIAKRLDDCAYKGFAAIRAVSRSLFDAFGLGKWLRHEREKAVKRREKKARKANPHIEMTMAGKRGPERKAGPQDGAAAIETRTGGPTAVGAILASIKASLKSTGPPS